MTSRFHCVKSVQIRRFFWSEFCSIRTEYGDLLRKSPYSVRIQENEDQKKLCIWTLFTQCLTNLKNFKRYIKENVQNFPGVFEPTFFQKCC